MSEMARQFYEDVLKRGFVSPETAGTEHDLIAPLVLISAKNYRYFEELKKLNVVRHLPAASIYEKDKYYAVPPVGWLAAHEVKIDTSSQFYENSDAAVVATSKGSPSVDWSKWGAIAGIVAIPLALALWWYS